MNNRHPLPKPKVTTVSEMSLLVLGSGWAGFELVRRVRKSMTKKCLEITMVSPRNYFVFTPLLASTTVGTLEYRAIVESIRTIPDVHFVQARVIDIDFDNKQVVTQSMEADEHRHVLGYDKLVIACGAVSNTFDIPGVATHAYFLKDIEDARRIRRKVIDCFDRVLEDRGNEHLVNFAIVGGGPTGVEFAAELHDFIKQDLGRYYPKIVELYAKITIYDMAPRILGGFDAGLAEYASKKFYRQGISVRTSTGVKCVNNEELVLDNGQRERVGMIVWATGLAPNPLVRAIRCDKDKGGVLVDDHLRLLRNGTPVGGVYAIGDCATVKENELPRTAQVAKQQSIYLSKGKPPL